MSAARKYVVPPGHHVLDDVVQEHGRDHAQSKLLSGEWPAFQLDLSTGDLYPIPVTTWGVFRGRNWLENGASELSDELVPPNHPALRLRPRLGGWRYAVIVQISERPPSRTNNLRGRKLAKELMDAVFPQGEWRLMKVRVVRKGCEKEANTRGVQLPSSDSFSRAMGRRRK